MIPVLLSVGAVLGGSVALSFNGGVECHPETQVRQGVRRLHDRSLIDPIDEFVLINRYRIDHSGGRCRRGLLIGPLPRIEC